MIWSWRSFRNLYNSKLNWSRSGCEWDMSMGTWILTIAFCVARLWTMAHLPFMEGYLVAGLSFKYVLLLLSISQKTAGWSNFQFVWAGSTYQVWSQLPAIYFGQDWTLCLWPTTCCDARDSASSSEEHCPRPSCERTGWLCRALEEDHCSLIYWKSSTETSAEESMDIMVLACGTWGVHQCNNWWIHFVGFQREKLGASWIRTWDVSSKIELQHTSITFWTFEDFDETK